MIDTQNWLNEFKIFKTPSQTIYNWRVEEDQQKEAINFLVSTVAKENFILTMSPNGIKLNMSIKLPLIFGGQTRLLAVNQANRKCLDNSGKDIAF